MALSGKIMHGITGIAWHKESYDFYTVQFSEDGTESGTWMVMTIQNLIINSTHRVDIHIYGK